uniref:DNA-directed DNA polymerase n=1 Tax=Caenorhabditis tropicalis TaxID=1561998 RepID=A0A1I7U811_9PELO
MTRSNVKAGVKFESPNLVESVGLSFKNINSITADDVVRNMNDMAQSNRTVLELDVPRITTRITYLNPPSGSGKHKFSIETLLGLNESVLSKRQRNEEVADAEVEQAPVDNEPSQVEPMNRKKRHIMQNHVTDNCLPHALYQTLKHYEWKLEKSNKDKQKQYKDSIRKRQDRNNMCVNVFTSVNKMKEDAGVAKNRDFDRLDVERFQQTVFRGNLQIVVFTKNSSIPYYAGPYVGEGKQLVLYLDDGHYCGVTSVCALLNYSYYCFLCNTGFNTAAHHYACKRLHRKCGQVCSETPNDVKKTCDKCSLEFRSEACYENHRKKGPRGGKSRCDITRFCNKCRQPIYGNKKVTPHICRASYCQRCQKDMEHGHHCIMMPSIKRETKLTRKRVYFDIESRADPQTGQQFPVAFVGLCCCPDCSHNIPKTLDLCLQEKCANCAPEGRCKIIECVTRENRNVNVAAEFTKWLFRDDHRGAVLVAHNASGYDGQFILENLIASNKAAPEICLDGSKLVFMNYNQIRLVDSLKYLTMSLSNVGKTFQVDSVKGDFPVKFIKPENYDYSGPLPDIKFYDLENKAPAVKEKITKYLEEERIKGTIFNFFPDLLKYCFNDVYILAVAMSTFEKAFETMTDESTTAASAAAQVFRRKHLSPEKPIVLDAKPSVSINFSIISQKMLAWIGASEDVQINISTTYGEEKIGNYRVDGFIPPCDKYPRGLVGCYYHAHKCTYSEESVIGDQSALEIWQNDEKRLKELEQLHPVRVVYECEVEKALNQNQEMSDFFENYEVVDVLDCQKSLVGGRTEVFRLYSNFQNQRGRYLDVVSLYPTVMKHEEFPIGEPKNVPRSEIQTPMTQPHELCFQGFLSCKLVAPHNLKLPLIPTRFGGKLVFALCKKCAKESIQTGCTHSEGERAFTGTFTTVELRKALSLGYKIIQVYHGIKYEKWVKNDANGDGGLFTSYINLMMEEKIYSSGWPSNVNTDEEKEQYCRGYWEKERIRLVDHSRFSKNAGKRAVAKLMLNSLWGKFAQRIDRENTVVIIDPMEFWKMFFDTSVVIMDVLPVNDVLVVKFRKQKETLQSLKTSAIQLASYTTSYARLRLYRFMELVGGDNILYTDTDSIVYAVPDGSMDPLEGEIGPYLGQLTDELSGRMTEFVTLGPKTYCYKDKLENGEEKIVRKTKGITINSQVEKEITMERMKLMVDEVLNQVPDKTVLNLNLNLNTMKRDRNHRVYSKMMNKTFKFTFDKRRILPDGGTLPFGYFE